MILNLILWLRNRVMTLNFTTPPERRHTLANLEPPPTDEDILKAFKENPWAEEVGVPARGQVFRRDGQKVKVKK